MWYFVKQRSFNGQKREIMWLLDSIISYTFVALWYWLAVQELANIALKLKGRGRIAYRTFRTQNVLLSKRQLVTNQLSFGYESSQLWVRIVWVRNVRGYETSGFRLAIDISTVFNMDQLGKIRQHHWKERLELVKFAKFKSNTFFKEAKI